MTPEGHRREVEAWRTERLERLQQPHGWLSLAGLHWLADGVSRIGSDPDSDVVLARGPLRAGRLEVAGKQVRAWAEAGSGLLHDGVPPAALRLLTDQDEGGPTPLDLGSLRMVVIRRGGRLALRVWDADAPLRSTFTKIDTFPIDPKWRIDGRFEPARAGTTVAVPDVLGQVDDEPVPGDVVFDLAGTMHRLTALEGGDHGELWLIFGDGTNGSDTYAGGRYLYTGPVSPDGSVVLDFNRAYNPPCVFTPYATCPLPPAGNRLTVRIEAGERRWAKS